MAFIARVLQFQFWRPDNIGEQWGLAVHDLDGDGFLDLFVNHHGTRERELVYGFATGTPRSVLLSMGGDLHGATFFDIDQDGDADLLQAAGADRGEATDPEDPSSWSRINLNTNGVLDTTNSVELFGLEYGLGRKRILAPVNLDGEIGVYAGVLNNRPDGLYPGQLFLRDATTGRYEAAQPTLTPLTGEIVKGAHLGTDRFTDIVNLDWQKRELWVHENRGAGFEAPVRLSSGSMVYDFDTGDFDGDLDTEILIARSGLRERLYDQNAAGNWSSTALPLRTTNTVALTAGDFNNDGALDYAALQHGPGIDVYVYLNRGDGTFEQGWRFYDPDLPGQAEFLISGDFNRDGALDLVATASYPPSPRDGAYVLLEGEAGEGNWLSLALKGTVSETGGLGARVYVTTPDGEVQLREQDGGVHFTSQDSTDLHFGLGTAAVANVRVVWPDGFMQNFIGVSANQHLVLTERRDGFERVFEGAGRADDLYASQLDDLVIGNGGNDVLTGRDGNDGLYGGSGDDRLFGGAGSDLLVGGVGSDTLVGAAGIDTFAFLAVGESPSGALRDSIRDFETGRDRIDLSQIDARADVDGDQAFVFIDGQGFDGLSGRLRFAGGLLQGDVDGNGVADFQIEVRGVAALAGGDLLL